MAVIAVGSNDNLQQKINAAQSGDTLDFGSNSFNVTGQLTLKSGITYKGSASLSFTTGNNQFAVLLPSPASAITIDGLKFKANCGVILAQGSTTDVKITNCDFVWGFNGTYYNRLAIRGLNGNKRLTIEHNNFHDSQSSDRNIDLWDVSDSSYSYNTFSKVHDGGHIDGTTTNFTFVGNVGSQIQRMGLELQDHNSNVGNNILIADNVFTDWYAPDNNSFGLSIMPQRATNVTIRNNYLSTGSATSTWSMNGVNTLSYGIEAGITSGIVQGNALIGRWVMGITCSMPNTQLKDNKQYGGSLPWGAFGTEPGNNPLGHGTISDLGGNQGALPISQAPPPPSSGTSSSSSTPAPSMTITSVTDHDCVVSFSNAPAGASLQVRFADKNDATQLGTVSLAANAGLATITNLPNGWELIAKGIVNGSVLSSVPFRTTGGPGAWPWTGGNAAIKPATLPDITKTISTPIVPNYLVKTIDFAKNSDGSPKLNEDGTLTITVTYRGL